MTKLLSILGLGLITNTKPNQFKIFLNKFEKYMATNDTATQAMRWPNPTTLGLGGSWNL